MSFFLSSKAYSNVYINTPSLTNGKTVLFSSRVMPIKQPTNCHIQINLFFINIYCSFPVCFQRHCKCCVNFYLFSLCFSVNCKSSFTFLFFKKFSIFKFLDNLDLKTGMHLLLTIPKKFSQHKLS